MTLKQSDIDELKNIYRQEFNEELENQDAWEMATTLVRFVGTIHKFIPIKKKTKRCE